MGKKKLAFRAWYYFRMGWSTYFAFIIAALNTMVTTYYLAIEKVDDLKIIFPSFTVYALFWVSVGIPILITIGYIHFKRVPAYSSELDVGVYSNPWLFKVMPGYNLKVVFPMYRILTLMLLKLSNDEKLNEDEISEIKKILNDLDHLLKGGYIDKPKNMS